MAQTTDQGAAPDLRFPDIESITSVSDVKDWLRKFRFEMETRYRELWRDSNKVFKTEIPGLITSITTVINFDVPLPNGLKLRKSGSDVIWDDGTIDYGGTTYSIFSGSYTPASEGGIYWDDRASRPSRDRSFCPYSNDRPGVDGSG